MTSMNELISKHYKQIYGYIYNMVGNREDAEDLTQETFIKVDGNFHTYDTSRSFINWALRIAQNTCTDFYRSKQREYKIFDTETPISTVVPFYHGEGHTEPPLYGKYRIVYSLKNVCDLKPKEIANICGITISTTAWIIRRARISLESPND